MRENVMETAGSDDLMLQDRVVVLISAEDSGDGRFAVVFE
jgi:hypothetical protein